MRQIWLCGPGTSRIHAPKLVKRRIISHSFPYPEGTRSLMLPPLTLESIKDRIECTDIVQKICKPPVLKTCLLQFESGAQSLTTCRFLLLIK